jgi:NADH-quinone oxidoreductase subunit J
MVDVAVFVVAAAIVLGGGLGVVVLRSPVHCALSLVASFFGVAVLFVDLDAHFLAAVQVIVYAGAIVVLFLFVLMLLGVDEVDDLEVDPLGGQRWAGVLAGVAIAAVLIVTVVAATDDGGLEVGPSSLAGSLTNDLGEPNVNVLGRSIFTDYVFAFEITSVLLVIAVVGAVVLARTPRATRAELGELADLDAAIDAEFADVLGRAQRGEADDTDDTDDTGDDGTPDAEADDAGEGT